MLSSVGIATGYWLHGRGVAVRDSEGSTFWGPPIKWLSAALFLGVNLQKREAKHMDLYLHCAISLHGAKLNKLSTGTALLYLNNMILNVVTRSINVSNKTAARDAVYIYILDFFNIIAEEEYCQSAERTVPLR
jgi:hypothetical protein